MQTRTQTCTRHTLQQTQGHELQGTDIEALQSTLASDALAPSLSKGVREVLCKLLRISTNKPKSQKKKKKKAKKTKNFPLPLEELDEAIKSAATKYDHPHTFFARKGGRMELMQHLITEVMADMPLARTNVDAAHQANAAINKFVGISFGKWKCSQRS